MIASLPRPPLHRALYNAYVALFFVYLAAPLVVVVVFAFNDSLFPSLPWNGFTLDWLLGEESASAPSGGLGAGSEVLAGSGEGGSRCGLVGLELLLPLASCWRRRRARATPGD